MNTNIGVGIEHHDGSVVCAYCGYELEWDECSDCGGEGGHDGYEDDPNYYQPGEMVSCCVCGGEGGKYWCETIGCPTQQINEIRKVK